MEMKDSMPQQRSEKGVQIPPGFRKTSRVCGMDS